MKALRVLSVIILMLVGRAFDTEAQITGIAKEGNNIRVTWQASPGTTNIVQVSPQTATGVAPGNYSGLFSDLSPLIAIPPGVTSTNYLDVGGATNQPSRFYRVRRAFDTPIAVTGFNSDVVVERTAVGGNTAPYATVFDFANNYAFYEAGLNGTSLEGGASSEGLPQGGAFTSVLDGVTSFQLGPYASNNVLYLTINAPSATLSLAAPAKYNSLSILATSANSGGMGTCVINFTDSTSSSPVSFNAPDWFNNPGAALTHFGRIATGSSSQFMTDDPGGNNPNLYQTSINLAALGLNTKPITSVTFTRPSGGGTSAITVTGIFALSGTLSP